MPPRRSRPAQPSRPLRTAPPVGASSVPRTALEYLEAWRRLFARQVDSFDVAPLAALVDLPDDSSAERDAADDGLLEGLDAFEAAQPDAPIVRLAHEREITPADLALLHVLAIDAQNASLGEEGFVVPILAQQASSGPNNTFALERLTPDAPIVQRGLVVVRDPEAPFLQRVVDAGPELLRIVWAERGTLAAQVDTMRAAASERVSAWGRGRDLRPEADETSVATIPAESAVGAFVLPPSVDRQFRQIVTAVREGQALRERFGFATTMPTARSSSVLFVGPPGTGKTTACRALAHALGKPLRLICAGDILDKYVGASERALQRAFADSERDGVVLAIDEIDALAYARETATQPFQRALVTQLLVLLERHPALVFAATTNEPEALDAALERRLAFRIEVPMPGPEERLRLWRELIPTTLPLAPDVDLGPLAQDHALSGALIRDAVWHAALAMRTRGADVLAMRDLLDGLAVVRAGRWTAPTATEPVGFRSTYA